MNAPLGLGSQGLVEPASAQNAASRRTPNPQPALPTLETQSTPRAPGDGRLLWLDANSTEVITPGQLAERLPRGTLLVANDAATLPAAFWVRTAQGEFLELRLTSLPEAIPDGGSRLRVVALGKGSFRDQTEARGPVPKLRPGARLWLCPPHSGADESSQLVPLAVPALRLQQQSGRLLTLTASGAAPALLAALYSYGVPVQYSYTQRAYRLGEVQNAFAGRPWAVEPASAGRHLTACALRSLRDAGHEVTLLTHAAGLSSTGDPELDAQLPFPERYDVPRATAFAVNRAVAQGRLVLAVGTSTTRALESVVVGSKRLIAGGRPRLRSGSGMTELLLSESNPPRIVSGLLTGIHEAGTSHRMLTRAFASDARLQEAWLVAAQAGLLLHEFGDGMLILPGAR